MSDAINKRSQNKLEYLKRYNIVVSDKKLDNRYIKRNKKKQSLSEPKGFKILDDDVDLILPLCTPHNLEEDSDDEKPFQVEFIDDRPYQIKQLEKFRQNGKWKLLSTENETRSTSNHFTHSRHDSESDCESQQISKRKEQNYNENIFPVRNERKILDTGSDLSPPRQMQSEDPDTSPIMNFSHDRDLSPPRQCQNKLIEVLYRDKTGMKRNFLKEKRQKESEEAKKKITFAKYRDWNKGLKQKEMLTAQMEDIMHEISKPLARYKNDKDLDGQLKEIYRDGDPMLDFVKKKRQIKKLGKEMPQYKGPEPPPNRFNLQPGYRWDGVDRSNGFERQYFFRISEKKAINDVAYKWSVEDM